MTKVLIADDNRQIRMLVSAALRPTGWDLVEAADGEEAIAAAVRERPDLVLLDVVMPKLDGFEVLHFIRKRPETQGCRVIMLTAEGSPHDRERGAEECADGYVVKPFAAALLRETANEVLSAESEADAASS